MIGQGGGLPWHLPDDMNYFKRLTTGHTVVMGRKTFEAIGGPLPNRRNIILSRDLDYHQPGADVASSLDAAIDLAGDDDEIFVAGGAEIYALALPRADRLYLTIVHATIEGDVCFPAFPPEEWCLTQEEQHPADSRHAYSLTFRRYERRQPVSHDVN